MRRLATRNLLLCALLLVAVPAVGQTPAAPAVLVQNGFEEGTLDGWIPRGGSAVILTNTGEAAATGSRSLKTTGRTEGFHGPSRNLTSVLEPGAAYRIAVSARLVSGEPAAGIVMTMQRTAAGQAPAYDRIAAANSVSAEGAWVRLEGQYTFPTPVSDLLLYVESPSATAAFLIDDFEVVRTAPAPTPSAQDNSGLQSTFESGKSTEGWLPRIGGEVLEVTTSDKHGGEASLLVSNRTRPFEGARIDVSSKMYNGSQYRIRAWVKLAASNETVAPAQLRLSLERAYQGANSYYTAVPNTRVTADAWVELSGVYTVAFPFDRLNLYIESAEGSASFLLDDFDLTYIPPVEIQKDIPSVAEALSSYFPAGAAIGPGALSGAHLDLLKKHFSAITAENAMKWESLQPREGVFTWANADTLMRFAATNGMKARGHTLVWHEQVPGWVFRDAATGDPLPTGGDEASKQLVLDRMRTHIREVMTRYKDEVFAWDVVNEAIDPSQPDCMRRSPWFHYTGLDFIDEAFRLARELNPEAKLFYNDYDTTNPNRRRCMVNLIRGLKERGVPIDGIGHQMHVNIEYPSIPSIAETLDLFYDELGIENHITELDMSVYTNSTATYQTVPEEILARQGRRYAELFELFRAKAGRITSVTFWGLADDNTWLKSFPIRRLDLPLLFDEKLQAKPAYWGVVDPSKLP